MAYEMTRTSDPKPVQVGKPGHQPMNYLILATIIDSRSDPWRARAWGFRHDADPQLNTP